MLEPVTLSQYITLSIFLFCIGIYGVISNYRSMIFTLISTELILLSANINFAAFSAFSKNADGIAYSVFTLAIAAAELSIGLAIILLYFKANQHTNINTSTHLKDNPVSPKLSSTFSQ